MRLFLWEIILREIPEYALRRGTMADESMRFFPWGIISRESPEIALQVCSFLFGTEISKKLSGSFSFRL
jgi:hypothetical protein